MKTQTQTKKINISSEGIYVIGIFVLSFAVAMISATDFGVSMIVAPAYILSEKISFLTFGQCEYIVQSLLLVLFCIIMKKFKPIYLASFLTTIIYGAVLDMWRYVIPVFNPDVTSPESLALWVRIVFYILGILLTTLGVAMFFKTYLYPEVYDLFVKGIVDDKKLNFHKFKTCFDLSFLVLALILSFAFFGKLHGISVGTVVMAFINGTLINFWSKMIDKYCNIQPRFKKLAKVFELK